MVLVYGNPRRPALVLRSEVASLLRRVAKESATDLLACGAVWFGNGD
jgi:hypothetical protein